jgi:hypothetical protein
LNGLVFAVGTLLSSMVCWREDYRFLAKGFEGDCTVVLNLGTLYILVLESSGGGNSSAKEA